MGNRRAAIREKQRKVAQLPFAIHEKKSELKSSEMQIAPQGQNKSSKHGIMWARRERTHMIQSLAEGAAPTTPNRKNKKENKRNER